MFKRTKPIEYTHVHVMYIYRVDCLLLVIRRC